MPQLDGQSLPAARRRGRPVGSDSAETRNTILRAARQVINERGYHAATFQAIAMAAGLSRPTLHYYFASREEIYGMLVADACGVIADCIGAAKRKDTLLEQLAALVAAMHEADVRDRSLIAFLVSARLEATRNPELEVGLGNALRSFLRVSRSSPRSRAVSLLPTRRWRRSPTCCTPCCGGWASTPGSSTVRPTWIDNQATQRLSHMDCWVPNPSPRAGACRAPPPP